VDNILGTNYAEQGKTTMAEKFFHKAYVAFEESGQDEMIGTALMNLGIVQNIRGNYQQALGQYRRAQSIFERLGDLRRLAQLHHNIGMTYLQWNRTKEAIVEFDASYFLGSKQQQEPVMATSLLGKANAFYKRSDLDVAAKLVGQALALFEQCGDRLGQADGYKLKGMIFRDKKDYVLASSCFQTSLRINRDLDNKLNIAETFFELGLMERHRRRNQPALEAFGEAAALFRQVGAREEMRKAEQEIRTINGGHHAS
jgi:tetratricopeptide (TPR) repeat protein